MIESVSNFLKEEFNLEVEVHNLDALTSDFHKNASTEEKNEMGELLGIDNFEEDVKSNINLMNISLPVYQEFESKLMLHYLNNTNFDKKKVHLADPGAKFPLNEEIIKLVNAKEIPLFHLKVERQEIENRLVDDYTTFKKWDSNDREGTDKGLRSNFIQAIDKLRKETKAAPTEKEELETIFEYYFETLEKERQPVYEEVTNIKINVTQNEKPKEVLMKVLESYLGRTLSKGFSTEPLAQERMAAIVPAETADSELEILTPKL